MLHGSSQTFAIGFGSVVRALLIWCREQGKKRFFGFCFLTFFFVVCINFNATEKFQVDLVL